MVAWPTPSYLDSQALNASVPTLVVATTTTDSSGDYSFSPDLSSLGATYVDADGSVSLEVDAVQDGTIQQWSVPAALPGSEATTSNPDVAVLASQPAVVDLNMATSSVTQTDANGSAEIESVPTDTGGVAGASSAAPQAAPDDNPGVSGCSGWTNFASYPNDNRGS